MIDLPDITRAEILALNAGPPHVATASAADMAIWLGTEYGIHVEPVIEETGHCPAAWHWLRDWHTWCPRYVEVAKRPLPPAPLYGALLPASSAWSWPPVWTGDGGYWGSAWGGWPGAGWTGADGGDRFEGDMVTSVYRTDVDRSRTVRRKTVIHVHDCCCKHDPVTPVPLPATGWLLAAALAGLAWLRRRRRT